MSLLTVSNLSLSIGRTEILRDIDLTLEPGEILGVIGESGSGKSLTALSIMQLLPEGAHLGGSITLDGGELIGLPETQLCTLRGEAIGMVFQEPMTALNPLKTIGDQVAETILTHTKTSRSEALRIAAETLVRVDLPQDEVPLSRYPHELSGGQRQRVVIAMAIALKPRILIADEPTTALDVTTQAQILALLRRLVEDDNMGLILITHDLAVVAGLAHRVAIMRQGEIVETGETLAVFRQMQHPYTKALFEASRHVPARHPVHITDAAPLLEVSAVVREYVRRAPRLFAPPLRHRAVDDVSFSIRRGENLGLVGESGSGKSTLARTILSLDPLRSGTITLDGTLLAAKGQHATEARKKLQTVFQDPYGSFDPRQRVDHLITEPFHVFGSAQPRGAERVRRVAEALETVGLQSSDAKKYIHEFSGGQRQRLAIARALIIKPALIILDEAVSALDVSIRAQILDLLAELSLSFKLSYLFISHDLTVVRAITDRVLVMKAGKIVEQGETETVFSNPQHAYTEELLAAAPNLEAALRVREAAL